MPHRLGQKCSPVPGGSRKLTLDKRSRDHRAPGGRHAD
jgi:hypothetical protein